MTRREEAIQQAAHSLAGYYYYWGTAMDDARAAVAAYEAHMRPEVTSVEELDALSLLTVVKGHDGFRHVKTNHDRWLMAIDNVTEPHAVKHVALPARVLHWGTE